MTEIKGELSIYGNGRTRSLFDEADTLIGTIQNEEHAILQAFENYIKSKE